MLPDVPEHGKDVGGYFPMLLAVHLVHLDTVLGSEVNIELALEIPCVRSEVVLPGGLCVPGMLRLLAVRLHSGLDWVPSIGMAGFRGVLTVGEGIAQAVGDDGSGPLFRGLAQGLGLDLGGVDGQDELDVMMRGPGML